VPGIGRRRRGGGGLGAAIAPDIGADVMGGGEPGAMPG
jgi:hypothetical protein